MEVDCRTVKSRIDAGDDFLFLDCRQPDEHAIVHIAAARLLPMNETPTRLAELEPYKERPIVVHCHHGGRSLQVAAWLRQKGFAQAQSMAGGIDQWAQEIEPGMVRY